MLADHLLQGLKFGLLGRLETRDLLLPELPAVRVPTRLQPGLVAGNVGDDLLDHRQARRQWRQTRIRWGMDPRRRRRTGRDQDGVELVVLRQLQMKHRIGPHLRGLKHHDHEAGAAQCGHDVHLVAAARLDSDPPHATLTQPSRQAPMAIRIVLDLEPVVTPVQRHVELAFASIDAGANHATFAHLPRPFLVRRTLGSFNHTGQTKSRSRSRYKNQPSWAAVGNDPTIGGPVQVAAWTGPFLSEPSHNTDSSFYKGGQRRVFAPCPRGEIFGVGTADPRGTSLRTQRATSPEVQIVPIAVI